MNGTAVKAQATINLTVDGKIGAFGGIGSYYRITQDFATPEDTDVRTDASCDGNDILVGRTADLNPKGQTAAFSMTKSGCKVNLYSDVCGPLSACPQVPGATAILTCFDPTGIHASNF